MPGELQRILDKAMEKDRELRYSSAAEFRTDLKRLKRDNRLRKNHRGCGADTSIWKWTDGAAPERLVEHCGFVYDADAHGEYLLALVLGGEKTGLYEKCIPLFPGLLTSGAIFALDGKSFLYAAASSKEVTIYRQLWNDGKLIGKPEVALKAPISFPLIHSGNAYDFSRDLSTIVYARPGGHADLYLLSQK